MADNVKMGYKGILKYGVSGTTASTQITNCRDIKCNLEATMEEVNGRGDGTALPKQTHRPSELKLSELSWQMINKSSDTALAALISAAADGTPVALLYQRYDGSTVVDADCYISMENGAPYKGVGTFDFKVIGVYDGDRDPVYD